MNSKIKFLIRGAYELIVDHISNCDLYIGNNKSIDRAISCIKEMDFTELKPGMHELDGEELFFNLIEYETKHAEERFWESHKKYIDLHFILEGKEQIGYEQFDRMTIKEDYNEVDDYFLLEGKLTSTVLLQKNDFMILYPNDVHMTGIKADQQEKVRKVVFKIKI